jgi:hypothetical protein
MNADVIASIANVKSMVSIVRETVCVVRGAIAIVFSVVSFVRRAIVVVFSVVSFVRGAIAIVFSVVSLQPHTNDLRENTIAIVRDTLVLILSRDALADEWLDVDAGNSTKRGRHGQAACGAAS